MSVEEIRGTVKCVGRLINELTDGTMQTYSTDQDEDEDDEHASREEFQPNQLVLDRKQSSSLLQDSSNSSLSASQIK